mmetsp:Transcript_54147/g.144730  ORF Transcript_54147/g.144730 Transcript_54147/m.144730 type:complete len:106 (-) Transcript_54147:56-373(-)
MFSGPRCSVSEALCAFTTRTQTTLSRTFPWPKRKWSRSHLGSNRGIMESSGIAIGQHSSLIKIHRRLRCAVPNRGQRELKWGTAKGTSGAGPLVKDLFGVLRERR